MPGGRPTKGVDRGQLTIRPERSVLERARESANEAGYKHLGDYISAMLARCEGLPELAPDPDLELPMTG